LHLCYVSMQTAELHIFDNQRPLADDGRFFNPMEMTEAGHIPRGEVEMELADTPMDSSSDEFSTARASAIAKASVSAAHLPSSLY